MLEFIPCGNGILPEKTHEQHDDDDDNNNFHYTEQLYANGWTW
jgi:hypothetical protein